MSLFGNQDNEKKKSRIHKLVTGLIIGGAVGSVLTYASHRKGIKDAERESPIEDQESVTELEQVTSAEKIVAEKAVRPVRRLSRSIFRFVWFILRTIFRIIARLGRKD